MSRRLGRRPRLDLIRSRRYDCGVRFRGLRPHVSPAHGLKVSSNSVRCGIEAQCFVRVSLPRPTAVREYVDLHLCSIAVWDLIP